MMSSNPNSHLFFFSPTPIAYLAPAPTHTRARLPGCAGITASMISFSNKIENRALDFCFLSGSNLLFTMDTPTTPSRTADYHSELDFIWGQLYDEMKKPGNKVKDSSLRLFCSRDVFELWVKLLNWSMRKGKNSRLRIYSPTRTAVRTTSVVPTLGTVQPPKWSPTLKWSPNRPRNDPQLILGMESFGVGIISGAAQNKQTTRQWHLCSPVFTIRSFSLVRQNIIIYHSK